MRNPNYKKKFILVLQELCDTYPNQDISFHLSFILEEYPTNFDTLPDKILYELAYKYKCEKDIDFYPNTPESELDRILREGNDLEHILDEDGEDDDF